MALKILNEKKPYELKELYQMNDQEIRNSCNGVYCDKETIEKDLGTFIKTILLLDDPDFIKCRDYESALMVNEVFKKNNKKVPIYLIDDQEQKDRSYIDVTQFDNLIIPPSYVMWGVKFNDSVNVSDYTDALGDPKSDQGIITTYDRELISEVKRLASMIREFEPNLTDTEKVILVSNYLQKYFQYIDGKKDSYVKDEAFVLNDLDSLPYQATEQDISNPKTALFNNFGVCRTFAAVTTLLCNNPYLNLNVRSVRVGDHAWNVINLDGLLYNIDNTRAITRSEGRMEQALKTTKFSKDYLLFGQDTSNNFNHEPLKSYANREISKMDFDRNYIDAAIEHLQDTGLVDFEYGDRLPYGQHKK